MQMQQLLCSSEADATSASVSICVGKDSTAPWSAGCMRGTSASMDWRSACWKASPMPVTGPPNVETWMRPKGARCGLLNNSFISEPTRPVNNGSMGGRPLRRKGNSCCICDWEKAMGSLCKFLDAVIGLSAGRNSPNEFPHASHRGLLLGLIRVQVEQVQVWLSASSLAAASIVTLPLVGEFGSTVGGKDLIVVSSACRAPGQRISCRSKLVSGISLKHRGHLAIAIFENDRLAREKVMIARA
mmetsp:Transcript_160770/g.283401  ORF Transcript_160770/g.283401 Transcript_160770/m.283401 type:complete len:243 (+) Transcript_160770:396-1124(+)